MHDAVVRCAMMRASLCSGGQDPMTGRWTSELTWPTPPIPYAAFGATRPFFLSAVVTSFTLRGSILLRPWLRVLKLFMLRWGLVPGESL